MTTEITLSEVESALATMTADREVTSSAESVLRQIPVTLAELEDADDLRRDLDGDDRQETVEHLARLAAHDLYRIAAN